MKGLKAVLLSLIAIVAVGATIFSSFPTLTASASAAVEEDTTRYGDGVTSGVKTTGNRSNLSIKKQTVAYNLGTPPRELSDGEKYSSFVTTEYEFYNSTDEIVEETLAFPVSESPYYSDFEEETISPDITINGAAVDYTVRYTYHHGDGDCLIIQSSEEICRGYAESDFFSPDLPVREYRFKANINGVGGGRIYLQASLFGDPLKTRYIAPYSGYKYLYVDVSEEEEFSVYVLGENEDISSLDWKGQRYNSLASDYTDIDVAVECTGIYETTFLDLALSSYDDTSSISKEDWYNAVYFSLSDDGTLMAGSSLPEITKDGFVGWYTYNITVNAGETAINSITSAIYPSCNSGVTPYTYEYTYYFSSPENFYSYGKVEIAVNTSMYWQEDEDNYSWTDDFEKVEGGYKISFPSYFGNSISFTFCSSENPATDPALWVVIIVSGAFGMIIIPAIFIVACIGAAKTDKKNRAVAKEKRSYNMYCVKCGKLLKEGTDYCIGCGAKVENPYIGKNYSAVMKKKFNVENKKRLNVPAVISFALSILAVVLVNLSVVHTFINALLAFILSIVGIAINKKYSSCYGLAIVGLLMSSLDLILICCIT